MDGLPRSPTVTHSINTNRLTGLRIAFGMMGVLTKQGGGGGEIERQREKETEREEERDRDRETETETERDRETETERKRKRERNHCRNPDLNKVIPVQFETTSC